MRRAAETAAWLLALLLGLAVGAAGQEPPLDGAGAAEDEDVAAALAELEDLDQPPTAAELAALLDEAPPPRRPAGGRDRSRCAGAGTARAARPGTGSWWRAAPAGTCGCGGGAAQERRRSPPARDRSPGGPLRLRAGGWTWRSPTACWPGLPAPECIAHRRRGVGVRRRCSRGWTGWPDARAARGGVLAAGLGPLVVEAAWGGTAEGRGGSWRPSAAAAGLAAGGGAGRRGAAGVRHVRAAGAAAPGAARGNWPATPSPGGRPAARRPAGGRAGRAEARRACGGRAPGVRRDRRGSCRCWGRPRARSGRDACAGGRAAACAWRCWPPGRTGTATSAPARRTASWATCWGPPAARRPRLDARLRTSARTVRTWVEGLAMGAAASRTGAPHPAGAAAWPDRRAASAGGCGWRAWPWTTAPPSAAGPSSPGRCALRRRRGHWRLAWRRPGAIRWTWPMRSARCRGCWWRATGAAGIRAGSRGSAGRLGPGRLDAAADLRSERRGAAEPGGLGRRRGRLVAFNGRRSGR